MTSRCSLWLISLLLLLTGAGVALGPELKRFSPAPDSPRQAVEVMLVMDTTGSMAPALSSAQTSSGELIRSLQARFPGHPLRLGVVAYRDRGEAYLTRTCPLATPTEFQGCLNRLDAGGGGNVPEAVAEALEVASEAGGWGQVAHYQSMVLIGDAPAYAHSLAPTGALIQANRTRGIHLHTLQFGGHLRAQQHWQQFARHGAGRYAAFNVEQSSLGAVIAGIVAPDAS